MALWTVPFVQSVSVVISLHGLEVRPVRKVSEQSTASPGNLPSAGHRVRFLFRAARYQHAGREDGLYRPWGGSRVRARSNRRAGEGWTSERQGEGQSAWAPQDRR